MVEAAGVEPFRILVLRKLLISQMAKKAQRPESALSLYVYCTAEFFHIFAEDARGPCAIHFQGFGLSGTHVFVAFLHSQMK